MVPSHWSLDQRLEFRIDHSLPKDVCWPFNGAITATGYGCIVLKKKAYYPHRLMWEKHKGGIPHGMFVLHRCDNRRCCNPNHLFLGTHKDNMRDMVNKKRHIYGDKFGHAIARPKAAAIIEALKERGGYGKFNSIARDFSVSHGVVTSLYRGTHWFIREPS